MPRQAAWSRQVWFMLGGHILRQERAVRCPARPGATERAVWCRGIAGVHLRRRRAPGVHSDGMGFSRAQALSRLAAEPFDVLVVGGGITGAGVALDAASRGLRTALVERRDFASGTSSKSSKLVHGGLRYLQQREYRLVYEALAERQRLRLLAPHLVHLLPFLLPVFGKGGVVNPKLAKALSTALWMYDLTGGARIGRFHERISAEEALAHMPSLDPD